jgi:hypothetical protein
MAVFLLIFLLFVVWDVSFALPLFGTVAGAVAVIIVAVALTAIAFILWKKRTFT